MAPRKPEGKQKRPYTPPTPRKTVDIYNLAEEHLLDPSLPTVVEGLYIMWKGKPRNVRLIINRTAKGGKRAIIEWYYNKEQRFEPLHRFDKYYYAGSESYEDELLALLYPTEDPR
jgi:hypothetical protein